MVSKIGVRELKNRISGIVREVHEQEALKMPVVDASVCMAFAAVVLTRTP